MKFLTPQEQKALIVVLVLLLVGMAVQTWRTAHPPIRRRKQLQRTLKANDS
jgi:hypothetical protein